jgi:hypothetical protein
MAQVPLLIIYQWAMRTIAFLLQHVPQVAGWLRHNPQADIAKQKVGKSLNATVYFVSSNGYVGM